jgi:hypothetical protein
MQFSFVHVFVFCTTRSWAYYQAHNTAATFYIVSVAYAITRKHPLDYELAKT